MKSKTTNLLFLFFLALLGVGTTVREAAFAADNWPRWRGNQGSAVSDESPLPLNWSPSQNIAWCTPLPGDGTSSPIVWGDHIFLTAALEFGVERVTICIDRNSGQILWKRSLQDGNPELASVMTGHAAPTPVTDGHHVVAWFGNAGCVCFDFDGNQKWHRQLGEFESELGLASSPILFDDSVILVCDHDGNRFRSFDSFIIALDLKTGETRWKTDRRGLFRSWSTPILVADPATATTDLIVNAQDELRSYDARTGQLRWQVPGMTGWVTPSPVFGHGLIFAASGKDGPTMAIRPGSEIQEADRIAWQDRRGAPYVCSPLLLGDLLYVHNEAGVMTCYNAHTGERHFRERLPGKFTASAVAGDGKIYVSNESGTTFVLRESSDFELAATNSLDAETYASPAIAGNSLFVRTLNHLWRIQ